MTLTRDQLVALHRKAALHLEIKLKKIPAHVFASGRKPTLAEIYLRPEPILKTPIPSHIKLEYVFKNHDELARAYFQARKRDQCPQISAAIFYWSIDPAHPLSSFYDHSRYNVLVAQLVLGHPKTRHQLAPNLVTFLDGFICAWLEQALRLEHREGDARDNWINIWKQGDYDLIIWSRKQLARMYAVVKALRVKVVNPPFNRHEFWDKAREQHSLEEIRKHGASWAVQYVIDKQHPYKPTAIEAQAQDSQYALLGNRLSALAIDTGESTAVESQAQELHYALEIDTGDGAPNYLSEELFNRSIVKALLEDVEEGITPEKPYGLNALPPEGLQQCWMVGEQAVALLEGMVSGLENITEQLSSMNFL